MNLLKPSLAIAALASLNFAPSLMGQVTSATATTDPVGFVSVSVNANSDQKIGVPMQQAPVFQGAASGVSGTSISATGLPVVTGANYLLVTSGSASGSWEQIATSAAGSLTLQSAITGFATGDEFMIRPFWTLGSLFPSGSGIPASSDVFSPSALVLLNNPAATGINIPAASFYLYHDGTQGPAGWYNANDISAGLQDNVVLSPEVSLTIRNQTSGEAKVTITGSVPVKSQSLEIVGSPSEQQDNLVYNQFPAGVTLGTSGLSESGAIQPSSDVFAPIDILLLYSSTNTGINPSATAFYLYHDGSQGPAGWYNANDIPAGLQDNVPLPEGAAFVIRKAAGSPSASWTPQVPYAASLTNN
jgi:uncharacterized protein (TIGR02597 family)